MMISDFKTTKFSPGDISNAKLFLEEYETSEKDLSSQEFQNLCETLTTTTKKLLDYAQQ